MKNFIKLTSIHDQSPVFIDPLLIGHLYEIPIKMSYGSVDVVRHTVVGTTTHNNGGFKVLESIDKILLLINN